MFMRYECFVGEQVGDLYVNLLVLDTVHAADLRIR